MSLFKTISFFFSPPSAGSFPEPSVHLGRGGGTEEHGEQLPRAAASPGSNRPLLLHSLPTGGAVSRRRQAHPLTLLEPVHTSSDTYRDHRYTQ